MKVICMVIFAFSKYYLFLVKNTKIWKAETVKKLSPAVLTPCMLYHLEQKIKVAKKEK